MGYWPGITAQNFPSHGTAAPHPQRWVRQDEAFYGQLLSALLGGPLEKREEAAEKSVEFQDYLNMLLLTKMSFQIPNQKP